MPEQFLFVIMGFFGMFMLYSLRVSLSVAIVSMVNFTYVDGKISDNSNKNHLICINNNNSDQSEKQHHGEFNWDPPTQTFIIGSFFLGYIITQIPGGNVAEKYGSKPLLILSIFSASILTIISPFAARINYLLFILFRVIIGMTEGIFIPSMHAMIAKWCSKFERGLLSTIIYSGGQIGTVITMALTGILIDTKLFDGWPFPFYVFGLAGILWSVLFFSLVHETQQAHHNAKKNGLHAIINTNEKVHKNVSTPWRSILTSIPVWALVAAHVGQNWGFYTLLFQLPTYFKSVLGMNIYDIGLSSSLPYLLQALVSWCSAFVFDKLIRKGQIKVNTARKLSNTIGLIGPAICFYLLTFAKCSYVWNMFLLCLAMGLDGFTFSGFNVTHVDMSPDFAGTLMGLTNCIANLPGIFAPLLAGILSRKESTFETWSYVFITSAVVNIVSALIFLFFGSAELQPWGLARTSNKDLLRDVQDISGVNEAFAKD